MKKLLLFSAGIVLFTATSFAKIWRVNNNAGINADFTTLQAAHNGAASGDTVYLESSATAYGGLTATKKLVIFGTGYYLDQNPGLQAFALPSTISAVTLNAGSAGSVIEGFVFSANTGININVNDVIIRRNKFANTLSGTPDYYAGGIIINSGASNIYILQNFGCTISCSGTSIGILIANNYIGYDGAAGDATVGKCIDLSASTVAIIKNNIFRRGTVSAFNSNISNNIMYAGFFSGTGNLTASNIANGTQFGTADGNKSNVVMSGVFELAGSSFDSFWKLKAGSPAIGAGYGSTAQSPVDAGIFGGTRPYVLSGIPRIPAIYFFANEPVGSNSDPIDVQIKIRSNQ